MPEVRGQRSASTRNSRKNSVCRGDSSDRPGSPIEAGLSHIAADGSARMVDVSAKPVVKRTAVAAGCIRMAPTTVRLLRKGLLKKGDALACARIAGVMAAKQTGALIPLCHSLPLDQVTVDFTLRPDRIDIRAGATCQGRTGVEMEALVAVSTAALTIYDMCKAVDKGMVIDGIRLVLKTKEPTV